MAISVDMEPSVQAAQRAQRCLRLFNGQAVWGNSHEYKRHGTTTLFAAMDVQTGLVQVEHCQSKRRREVMGIMERIVA